MPLGVATRAWFAISLQTFGGPAGQIAVMQHELVDQRRWIGQRRFLHALSFCTLLPGPEAQQLAIYIGWLLNGVRGGLVAGILFVLPGVVALLGLSAVYVSAGDTTVVTAVFAGLAPAVLAIVAQAVIRVGGRALGIPPWSSLAVAAFVALCVFAVPFPFVVRRGRGVGWALGRWAPHAMRDPKAPAATPTDRRPLIPRRRAARRAPEPRPAVKVLAVGLVAWAVPVGVVAALAGRDSIFADLAPVLHRRCAGHLRRRVRRAGLRRAEGRRGLRLAGTRRDGHRPRAGRDDARTRSSWWSSSSPSSAPIATPAHSNPWVAAVIAALLTTWVTFVPCFVFVFVGAPYVERLRGNQALSAALTGIMAAVVGVIANLAIFFAVHTLFREIST